MTRQVNPQHTACGKVSEYQLKQEPGQGDYKTQMQSLCPSSDPWTQSSEYAWTLSNPARLLNTESNWLQKYSHLITTAPHPYFIIAP